MLSYTNYYPHDYFNGSGFHTSMSAKIFVIKGTICPCDYDIRDSDVTFAEIVDLFLLAASTFSNFLIVFQSKITYIILFTSRSEIQHYVLLPKSPYQLFQSVSSHASLFHDDVIKWKHFPRYWPFVWGIHRWPVNSPHKGQWHGALMFLLICACISVWANNREAGDLRRHSADLTSQQCTNIK